MEAVTNTLTITMAMFLSVQECGCDGVCGVGALGEVGPFQVLSMVQMEKIGCPVDEIDWWNFDDAMPCVSMFVDWLRETIQCKDPRMTWAAYNWGVGNVLRNGCNFNDLPVHVQAFASFSRVKRCGLDQWKPQRERSVNAKSIAQQEPNSSSWFPKAFCVCPEGSGLQLEEWDTHYNAGLGYIGAAPAEDRRPRALCWY